MSFKFDRNMTDKLSCNRNKHAILLNVCSGLILGLRFHLIQAVLELSGFLLLKKKQKKKLDTIK